MDNESKPDREPLDETAPGRLDRSGTIGPADRDEQLGEAIESYLERAEAGAAPDPEAFAAGYPELGDDLVAALEGLALVKGLVGAPNGPAHRLEEGRRVAGYRIVRELGRGGMGIVYEAVHVGLDRPVALKVLGSQATPDSSGRRRFLNEARTAAGLHHTHIVPVFDVGQVGGLCYYAMQRIEGTGIDRVLKSLRRDRSVAAGSTYGSSPPKPGRTPQNPPADVRARPRSIATSRPGLGDETLSWGNGLSEGPGASLPGRMRDGDPDDAEPAFVPPRGSGYYRWVAGVGRQAAEALAHAHQRGIIHRDIKPSNLLVDARGMIWVADFGLARKLADPSQTQVDSLLGTPRYMSPEQARTGAIDGRADIYSLGATLYELISLRPPFDGQTAAELIDQIGNREPSRPRKFDARVPLDLETIILKALAKRAVDRYPTAAELADDLQRFLSHEPVKARRIGPIGRTWRFARRHPGASVVSVLASSAILATATVAYVRVVEARNRADGSARVALSAKSATDEANRQLQKTIGQLRSSMLDNLENQADNLLLSSTGNRRTTGLDLIRRASARVDGVNQTDEARRVRLRDRAIEFLSLRDVRTDPPIPTPSGSRRELMFGPGGQRLFGLSEEGDVAVWEVADSGRKPVDSSQLPIAPNRKMRGGRPGGGGGGGGGPRGVAFGDRFARAGEQLVAIQPDGDGLRWFDLSRLDTEVGSLAIKDQHLTAVGASADGRLIATVGRPADPSGGNRGPNRRPDSPPRGAGAGIEGRARFDESEPDEVRISLWDRDRPDAAPIILTPPPPRVEVSYFARERPMMMAVAPDGSRVAAAWLGDSDIALWDRKGVALDPVSVEGNASTLTLGPAGLLAVGGNGDVALWDLSGTRPRPLPGLDLHQGFVNLLRFSPGDGSVLAASVAGRGVGLWDLSTRSPIATLSSRERVNDLAFSPDGRTLAASQSTSVALWTLVEPLTRDALPETGDVTTSLAFGPGDLLAIASRDAGSTLPVRLWGGNGQCPPLAQPWPALRPQSVGFDWLGRMVVPEADAIRWYDPTKPEPVAQAPFPADRPLSPRFNRRFDAAPIRSPDGKALIVGRPDGPYLWSSDRPEAPNRLSLPDNFPGLGMAQSAAIAPGGGRLYHVAYREQVMAHDLADSRVSRRPAWSVEARGTFLALSPDGSTLAVGEVSGSVRLIDPSDGSTRFELSGDPEGLGRVESLAFSPDGRTLAVGRAEQVRIWDVSGTPRPLVRLPGHRGSVRHLTFDADGSRLADADDKAIKVWDIAQIRRELAKVDLNW